MMQGISYSIYILTAMMFATLLFLVYYYTKKPPKDQVDYLTVTELEKTGWQLVNEIRTASESYIEKMSGQFEKIDAKIEEAKKMETALGKFDGYSESLEAKKEEIEAMLAGVKAEIERLSLASERPEQAQAEAQAQPAAQSEAAAQEAKDFDDKKTEIYKLHEQGMSAEEISKKLNVHSGFVQVLLNMSKLRKNS